MRIPDWLLALVGLSYLVEQRRAEAAIRAERALYTAAIREEDTRFARVMAGRGTGESLLLGHTEDGTPYRFPLRDFPAHLWISGGTGSGKSTASATWVRQLYEHMLAGAEISLVLVVMQGFSGDMVLRALGATLLGRAPEVVDAALSRLVVAQFFRGTHLPEWQLLARDPSVPIMVQAAALAEVLEIAVGATHGNRLEVVNTMVFALAIEAGLTLQELRVLLYDPEALAALAARSSLPEVRLYVTHRLARERAQVDAVGARLDLLLRVEAARAVLAGPGTLNFRDCFRPGHVTILDYSGEGMGAEGAKRALAAVALQYLSMAIFDPRRERVGTTIIVADEIQEALTPATTRMLSRWVSTSRAMGASLVSIHQSAEAQLPREFATLLSTNIRLRVLGRSGREDAMAPSAAEFLPRTGRVPRPRLPGDPPAARPEWLSRAEEAEFRARELGTLPQRTFFIHDRLAPFGTRRVVAPDFDVPELDALPEWLRARLLRGATGRSREELLARARELEERASASAAAAEGGTPRRTRRAPLATETPDIVSATTTWRRTRGRPS